MRQTDPDWSLTPSCVGIIVLCLIGDWIVVIESASLESPDKNSNRGASWLCNSYWSNVRALWTDLFWAVPTPVSQMEISWGILEEIDLPTVFLVNHLKHRKINTISPNSFYIFLVSLYWLLIESLSQYLVIFLFIHLATSSLSYGTWDLCCIMQDLLFWRKGSLVVMCRFKSTQTSAVRVHRLRCPMACGILVPWPGIIPTSPALQDGFLTTREVSLLILMAGNPTCFDVYWKGFSKLA